VKLSLRQRFRAAVEAFRKDTLQPVMSGFSALTRAVQDWVTSAWQTDTTNPDEGQLRSALTVAVVYDCVRRISTDIAKLSPGVRRLTDTGVWLRDKHQAFSRLIYRPNHFQTWFQFMVCWVCSRLLAGNAYIIKLYKSSTNTIDELIVLDPTKVTVLVATDSGKVFYQVGGEPLARVEEDMIISSDDLIHDRYLPLGHPLVGTSPLERALVPARARQGIITNAADLNEHASVPPGILYAAEGMDEEKLNALADKWRRIPKGRIAVLDQSFKFEALSAKYVDSQSQELAEMSATDICVAFGMPPWKVGLGTRPPGQPEALQVVYLQDCIQWQVEEIEQCLDHGLQIPADVYVELDTNCLLKMDSKTKAEVAAILVKGVAKPDEMRAWFDWEPVPGGNAVYMQQQNFSLDALAKRDAMGPPPAAGAGTPPSQPEAEDPEDEPQATTDDAEGADARAVPGWVGVYSASREYPKDCTVTHKRGLWLAQQSLPAGAVPGNSPGWRLIAGHNKPLPGEGA
jgi:HK97 family phage portal protein